VSAAPLTAAVTLGTRASNLARVQTDNIVELLAAAWPGLTCTVRLIETQGDRSQERGEPIAHRLYRLMLRAGLERVQYRPFVVGVRTEGRGNGAYVLLALLERVELHLLADVGADAFQPSVIQGRANIIQHQPAYRVAFQARQAQFGKGRHLRQHGLALIADHVDDADLAGLLVLVKFFGFVLVGIITQRFGKVKG